MLGALIAKSPQHGSRTGGAAADGEANALAEVHFVHDVMAVSFDRARRGFLIAVAPLRGMAEVGRGRFHANLGHHPEAVHLRNRPDPGRADPVFPSIT